MRATTDGGNGQRCATTHRKPSLEGGVIICGGDVRLQAARTVPSGWLRRRPGQLTLSSKYKPEFTANMSHELLTPLNSLLILAQQLEYDSDHNMTDAQVEYASVIRASGNDLLTLLNSNLELANA